MSTTTAARIVEVFTAGCPACDPVVDLAQRIACDDCDVRIVDMNDADGAARADELGIQRVPAVAVDGTLAACCRSASITEEALRAEGIGQPV